MTALRSTLRDMLATGALIAAGTATGLVIAIIVLTVKFLVAGS